MITVTVQTESHHYPIFIGKNLLTQAQLLLPHLMGKKVMIITNSIIADYYLPSLLKTLEEKEVYQLILPEGEAQKNIATLSFIIDHLVEKNFARDSTLLALGGGVIGDLTGFAASCYLRGIPFIQIPTSLLAQVDSSVGGKTGVNHAKGKNLIGAFYQPQAVFCDIETLKSLPQREFIAGLAEVIKYGLIANKDFFQFIEQNIMAILNRHDDYLIRLIETSCRIKADIVAKDEKELHIRALLNFGHTFGHAFETLGNYQLFLHGEAVGLGMLVASKLSFHQGFINQEEMIRITSLLAKLNFSFEKIKESKFSFAEILSIMQHDKKVKDNKIRLILLEKIGQAFMTSDYDLLDIQKVFEEIL